MAGGQSNVVSVPVRLQLENLKETISQIQSSLKGVKVDSSAYSKMTKDLEKAASAMLSLEAQTSKAFVSQNQFNQAEKEIGKIEEALQRTKIQLGEVQFKDLKLSPEELKPFEEIEQKIKDIKSALSTGKKQQLIDWKGTDIDAVFTKQKGHGIDTLTTYAEVIATVEKELRAARQEAEKTQKALDELNANKTKSDNTNAMINKANQKNATINSVFGSFVEEKYFRSDGTYKNKNNFIEYLKQNFKIDDATVEEIKQNNAKKLVEILKRAKVIKTDINKISAKENDNNAAQNRLAVANAAYNQVAQGQEKINVAAAAADVQIENLNQEITEQQEIFLANRRAALDNANAYDSITAQATQMRQTLASCNAEFIQQQRVLNTFNSLKSTIANFMGFTQVLNLAKRAASEAMEHIKKLDSVITEIAVVTDFNQSDLWGQIETYSEVAQEYGVAIEGVYEVSALYYQMGLNTDEVMARNVETLKMAKIASLDYATAADYMTVA